jgi:hypothetical protein
MWNPRWKWIGIGALALVSAQAAMALDAGGGGAGNGLGWSNLQGRISLGTASPGLRIDAPGFDTPTLKLSSLSLMADYYLTPSFNQGAAGGLRATSGVLFGPRSSPWSGPGSGSQFSIDRRINPTPDGSTDSATSPYVGIGYTGLSVKGGWGFSADVGVLAGRFGRNLGQSLDDQVRELRLQPVLQLGVSYSF